jgi:hypothetical protein
MGSLSAAAGRVMPLVGVLLLIAVLIYLMHRSRRPDPKWKFFSALLGAPD